MRLFFLLISLFFSCSSSHKKERKEILVSIPPYQFLVGQIVKEIFSVHSIVPSRANSHFYEPSPDSFRSLESVVVWFQIGEPFEKRLSSSLKERFPRIILEDLRKGLPLLSYAQDTENPSPNTEDLHIWMSPKLFAEQAKKITQTLSFLFPEKASFFEKNLAALLLKLEKLDQKIRERTSFISRRVLLASHPALGYFCHDYHFLQLSLEWEGKELSLKQIITLLSKLKQEKPALVVTMPQHPSKGALYIAQKLEIPIEEINPYSENYLEMMEDFSKTLSKL